MKKFLFALMGLMVMLPVWAEECGCVRKWNVNIPNIVITFDVDKTDVCDCAEQKIRDFLQNLSDVKEVELMGSADRTGRDEYNKRLSSQRIDAVKAVIPYSNLQVIDWNMGESAAYLSGGNDMDVQYRSVTIMVAQEPVGEICNTDEIKAIIEKYPQYTAELRDACSSKNLDNAKIVSILEKLAREHPNWNLHDDTIAVYKLWAELSDKIVGGNDLKKWRNVDGSFNTARLASDSIAGVVLGTVGGVVTSSIIKKNQVADGFEDIKCAIGGQSVASYGDEFSVGLQ